MIVMTLLVAVSGCSQKKDETGPTDQTQEQSRINEPKTHDNEEASEENTDTTKEKPADNQETKLQKQVEEQLATMSLEEQVGQLIMTDFRKYDGKNLTVYNDRIGQQISDYHIGGVIMFRENCQSKNQTKQLIQDFQKQAKIPLMIAIDQEGGLVTRLPFAPTMPGNMALGATRDLQLAEEVGVAIGSELEELGIHIDFAPDIDVNSNVDNPVIGVRSFGDTPQIVSDMGIAYMKGLNKTGVGAVGKHFPGHGDVALDSHFVLPTSNKTLDELRSIELVPFKKLMDAGIQGVMSAHITFPQIETDTAESEKDGLPIEIPATLSPKFLTDIARNELQYQGLIFTDAMDMKAIANHFGEVDAAIRAINAGVDVVLMPSNLKLVYDGVLAAAKDGRIPQERIQTSVSRILRFKYEYIINQDKDSLELISAPARRDVEQRVANASITLVRNEGIIPLQTSNQDKIAIIGFSNTTINRMHNAISDDFWKLTKIKLTKGLNMTGKLARNQKDQLQGVTRIIMVTNTSNQTDAKFQTTLVKEVLALGMDTIVVAARNPYELDEAVGAKATIAQYDNGVASFQATGDVIFGKLEATGTLPVKID